MRRSSALAVSLAFLLATSATAYAEKRCGWIVNPTPGNWWLNDKDGQWNIMAQGGFQAKGMNRIPDLTGKQWVATNGPSYGYGCGCVTGTTNASDASNLKFVKITAFKQRSLASCKADSKLASPG
jgi:Protein of unknown function (DUF4087)